jgi:hypothetical protein
LSASSSPTPPAGGTPESHSLTALRRRRGELAEQVLDLHWDLGGLAYEMAIRDHFRLDVLVRRAALLQERDAELAEVERLLRLEESASAGACPGCGAPHSRGALFCWQCGTTLMERAPSSVLPAQSSPEQDTVVIDHVPTVADGDPGAAASGPGAVERDAGAADPVPALGE